MTMEYVYILVMYALLPEFSISIQSRLVHCAPDLAAASTAPMVILLSSLHALKQVINIQATFFQCTYTAVTYLVFNAAHTLLTTNTNAVILG